MHRKRTAILAALLSLVAMATTVVAAAPASAVSAYGCQYPRVCFYLDVRDFEMAERPTASYRDMTSYWQWLGPRSRAAAYVHNTRNNDGAKLLMESGHVRCLWPNDTFRYIVYDPEYTVVAIQIVDSEIC